MPSLNFFFSFTDTYQRSRLWRPNRRERLRNCMRGWGRFLRRASSLLQPCCAAGSAAFPKGMAFPHRAGTVCSVWTYCLSKVRKDFCFPYDNLLSMWIYWEPLFNQASSGETLSEAAAAAARRINPVKASLLLPTSVEWWVRWASTKLHLPPRCPHHCFHFLFPVRTWAKNSKYPDYLIWSVTARGQNPSALSLVHHPTICASLSVIMWLCQLLIYLTCTEAVTDQAGDNTGQSSSQCWPVWFTPTVQR